ncbi:activating signal cointegrator 1 [Podospora conica]|nr:activating signal cointegrator 1 [Schizothecium conicum]
MSQLQLSRILPLPEDELKQVLDYASTLSKEEAAVHFSNLLGDSPRVIEFISSFNAQRSDPKTPSQTQSHQNGPRAPSFAAASSSQSRQQQQQPAQPNRQTNQARQTNPPPAALASDYLPKPGPPGRKKKKAPAIHTPPPRQVFAFDAAPGAVYNKKDQHDDYITGKPSAPSSSANTQSGPSKAAPVKPAAPPPQQAQPQRQTAGTLVSDLGLPKPKPKSNPASRSSTPGPSSRNNGNNTTKVTITGGVPMHGASTALSELDQAIRSLEITTNPTHASNSDAGIAARRCNCVATQHPLLAAAPNCQSCGKVICIKEGLGPCTFCGQPLLSTDEVQSMIKELRAERSREKQAADRAAHKKAEAGRPSRPFALPQDHNPSTAELAALEHRDRLLKFQAQNAQRTTIRDEASDFDATLAGSMWASPEERALALKKQQKLLRDMEWNAMPEYDKRRQVISIDISGRKVFKKMAKVERPVTPEELDVGTTSALQETGGNNRMQGGAFSRNPLLGGLIKPVFDVDGTAAGLEGRKDRSSRWRRVQDDFENNEDVILDGGVYGGTSVGKAGDEPACG